MNIFSRLRLRERQTAKEAGKGYQVWRLCVPLLSGLVFGYCASVVTGYALDKLSGNAGMADQAVTGANTAESTESAARGLDEFLAVNPFHISPQKTDTPPPPPKPKEEPKPPEQPSTLDNVVLRGTLPGVGGWFEKDGKLSLVLVGKTLEKYRLSSVKYDEAVFRRGKNKVTMYITYGPVPEKKKEEPKVAEAPKPKPAPAPAANTGNIVAAGENKEGEIPSEMVNQLVQNPFDELKRIRMRPNEKAGGLEVQWIQNDSILKRLGVQRGDVIKSVNGIPFTNMGDIANSINSLMNSERFDVEVTRGGNSTALRYVVR